MERNNMKEKRDNAAFYLTAVFLAMICAIVTLQGHTWWYITLIIVGAAILLAIGPILFWWLFVLFRMAVELL